MSTFSSWGRYPKVEQEERFLEWRHDPLPLPDEGSYLPVGQGRSYGDSCLNEGNTVLHNRMLNRFISFDMTTGVLHCESGVTLAQILDFAVPRGWFLPVTPGTKFVSVGGAIANDVHGKNHHVGGTFGCFVDEFELARSDGSRLTCSATENEGFYRATIGGLGLTGFILSAKVRLKSIRSPFIEMDSIKFKNLDHFFSLSEECSKRYEYTVSWLDCVSSGEKFGRGIFMGGNHSEKQLGERPYRSDRKLSVPLDLPSFAISRPTISIFNELYYNKQRRNLVSSTVSYEPFFYPLDAILNWNKLYGKQGFLQFQCVAPRPAITSLLEAIVASGGASFLAVLKEFGDVKSPGLLSFPKPGVTLALDFAFRGDSTVKLFAELDAIVRESGGRLYPAKDAQMSGESFRHYYPDLDEFLPYLDERASSSFWRRVTS